MSAILKGTKVTKNSPPRSRSILLSTTTLFGTFAIIAASIFITHPQHQKSVAGDDVQQLGLSATLKKSQQIQSADFLTTTFTASESQKDGHKNLPKTDIEFLAPLSGNMIWSAAKKQKSADQTITKGDNKVVPSASRAKQRDLCPDFAVVSENADVIALPYTQSTCAVMDLPSNLPEQQRL